MWRSLPLALMEPPKSRNELLEYQDQQLRRLVSTSYGDVPYYRDLFDVSGIDPGNFKGLADLERIPVTSKRDLLSHPEERILSRRHNPVKLLKHRTNGSTGEPFVVRRSRSEDILLSCFRLRALRSLGLKRADKLVTLRIPPGNNSARHARWMQQLRMFGCTFVDSTQLPEQIVKQLSELQPDVINGLGGPIYLAAKSLNRGVCRAIRPKFLALGGDTLTPSMIRVIEEVFQAPVFIFYGSHEFNLIASQCPLGGELHVLDDSVLLEVLDDGKRAGPGESGQVVATALHSFSQPFIRYKLGDIATRGRDECSCGSPCSSIAKIEGRVLDRIILPNGRLLSPDRLFFVIEQKAKWIRQYQLNQSTRERVKVNLVARREPSPSELLNLRKALQDVVGEGIRVETRLVASIPVGPGGKLRLSHSSILDEYLSG